MTGTAHIFFHGALNDFLQKSRKNTWIIYTFKDTPAVKDALEALGVPHVEVSSIRINEQVVRPYDPLHYGDRVQATPFSPDEIQANMQQPPTFVVDVNAGSLAKTLRMLGFDTAFENGMQDNDIAALAARQNRIVLTRDIALLKHKIIQQGYWLRSQLLREQLDEVMSRYGLRRYLQPFTRCIACNGLIYPVDKSAVINQLPVKVKQCYDRFFQCSHCKNVYWEGTHYARMTDFINTLPAV